MKREERGRENSRKEGGGVWGGGGEIVGKEGEGWGGGNYYYVLKAVVFTPCWFTCTRIVSIIHILVM